MAPAQHAPAPAKKGKSKKAPDPSEQQKQIYAKIAQLEQEKTGDKEQELEIGASLHLVVYVSLVASLHGRICAAIATLGYTWNI